MLRVALSSLALYSLQKEDPGYHQDYGAIFYSVLSDCSHSANQKNRKLSCFVIESTQTNFGRGLKEKNPVNAFSLLSIFGKIYPDPATMLFMTVCFIASNIEWNLSKPTHIVFPPNPFLPCQPLASH